jgi:type VI secretion system secreted protein Hcp
VALDAFLKITDVSGESKDKAHEDEIDVLGWNWGATNPGSARYGGGSGAGKVEFQVLSATKYVDKTSPTLFLALCNGRHFDEAALVVRKAGEKPLEYLKITMTQMKVAQLVTGGSGGKDRVTEDLTLHFAKFKMEYKEQSESGTGGARTMMGWDIAGSASE